MPLSLEQQANAFDNDYTELEDTYRRATGTELVTAPYESVLAERQHITLRASMLVPAWNVRDTLEQCLIAIEQSTFNRRFPEQLEVVVVDDGSTDGTWDLLERLELNVHLKAVRQAHHSLSHTRNLGIAVAEGDVMICCDADMILAPFAIEELMKRHQVLDCGLLLGFRTDIDRADPRIQSNVLVEHLPHLLPPFVQDFRTNYGGGGWPNSMCRDSDHLKWMRSDRPLITREGRHWNLPGMVVGALFSLRRRDYLAIGGYDERFRGWGCEDTLIGLQALAMGWHLLPAYSAVGFHIAHRDRSPHKWQELAANLRIFQSIQRSPFAPEPGDSLNRVKQRIERHLEREPSSRLPDANGDFTAVYRQQLGDPHLYGKYLHALARYEESAEALGQVKGAGEQDAWACFDRGKALFSTGRIRESIECFQAAMEALPGSVWPPIYLARALAGNHDFIAARRSLETARAIEPGNAMLEFLLRSNQHMERAAYYAQHNHHRLAVWDYEAVLIQNAALRQAQMRRAESLRALGQTGAAQAALFAFIQQSPAESADTRAARLELARLHLTSGKPGTAKVVLEHVRRLPVHDPALSQAIAELDAALERLHTLPLPRRLTEVIQPIPGWLSTDEAELLAALALHAVGHSISRKMLTLVEIGSYCGRATALLGLAVRSLDRHNVRIISVHDPSLPLSPDGRPVREVLRANIQALGLADLIVYAPEQDAKPWAHAASLVLVDGQHDYANVCADSERYGTKLVPGGLLVFHDYADYFPDVQRRVDEMMLGTDYEFVAHAGTLIALRRLSKRGSV